MSSPRFVDPEAYDRMQKNLIDLFLQAFLALYGEERTLDLEFTDISRPFVPVWVASEIVHTFAREGIYLQPLYRYGPLFGREQFFICGFREVSA